jgi:hypothetical protein
MDYTSCSWLPRGYFQPFLNGRFPYCLNILSVNFKSHTDSTLVTLLFLSFPLFCF